MPVQLPFRPSATFSRPCRVVRESLRSAPSFLLREINPAIYSTATRQQTTASTAYLETLPIDKRSPADFHRFASRHVVRGILRELTYFPDSFAADWLRRHALSRFRTYALKAWKHRNDEAYQTRLETVRRKSRQALYQLQRANEGDRKMLLKALSMAYGRTGKRRRELMYPLLPLEQQKVYADASSGIEPEDVGEEIESPSVPATEQRVEATVVHEKFRGNNHTKGPVKLQIDEAIRNLPARLSALVHSQIAETPPPIARRNPRRLGVDIPELNSWHKPMPQVRVDNQLQKWYASLLSTVQPPLREEEWIRLRDLATGATRIKVPVSRRKKLAPEPSMLETVVIRGKIPDNQIRKTHAHRLTPRFMRRVWSQVFSQCPLMERESDRDKWKITWGHHVLAEHSLTSKSRKTKA